MICWRPAALAAAASLAAALAAATPVSACDLAKAPNSHWTTVAANGALWFVSPCGERMLSLGVNVLDAGASGAKVDRPHYPVAGDDAAIDRWTDEARGRLRDWGFNSAGAWSLPPDRLHLPAVINLELGRIAQFHWFDPFDPATTQRVREQARLLTAPYRGSPYRIGYFSDNEVGWWSGALFSFYGRKPPDNHTKQRWLAALRDFYRDDWQAFAADFVPPRGVQTWDGLLASEGATLLRPGGHGSRAVRRWTEIVADHYYAVTAAALHAADPEALFLGDRLPIYYDPVAIRAEARHVDAIAANYNVDSPDGWIAPYFFDGLRQLTGGKPVLISEWFFAARENRTGNRNNGHLMTVDTQAQRARGAASAAANFAGIPEIVGLDWFQYYDYPVGGRADSEDYNFGLVDIDNRPYADLVSAFGTVNRRLPSIHAAAHAMKRPSPDHFTMPQADIDPAHLSLIDWPKPAALLPPLKPSPGEIPFGEIYLSWSDDGIAVATIGQDYYDPDLLAYAGDFPLSEAYRIELDADVGGGPKRFTLFLVPHGAGNNNHLEITPLLCAGSAAATIEGKCTSVAGGKALYFGADQPRITAEALLPWSAFGVAGPPDNRRLKVEVSASAWFRSRWMSLSGSDPTAGSADPAHWAPIRLGPAAAL
jgi:putative intracellular protease/amidase